MKETKTEQTGKSYAEKNRELYEQQIALLERFRTTGAISELQYKTSLQGLKDKMKLK